MQRAVRKDALHFLRLMLDAFGAQMWAFQTELLPIFLSILADRDVVNDAQIAKCASFAAFVFHQFVYHIENIPSRCVFHKTFTVCNIFILVCFLYVTLS
jgi:hypothetical protein